MLKPILRIGGSFRAPMHCRLWLRAACSLLLVATSTAFAQEGKGRGIADFDEMIRREELKTAPSGPAAGAAAVQRPGAATSDLAQMVQVELRRVGCDPGPPDGIWGPASQQALASFDRYGQAQYSTATPTPELLADIRGRTGRVCPAAPPPEPVASRSPELTTTLPPEATSFAGTWRGGSDCPLDQGFDLVLTASGPSQYRITGTNGIAGWVSGTRVHMEAQILINHIVWDGMVDSPATMGGTVAPSLMLGNTCRWQARKR